MPDHITLFKRKPVPKHMRQKIHKRFGGVCYLCGRVVSLKDMHVHHILPLSRGGPNTISNFAPTHATCNLRKSNKL